ncbi:putative multidrug resistance-associated protein [Bisporella sp. PMI_857]|nr:putative multidrug resistance-associated protein [Bisporella sp. PMI_857]
MSSLNRNLSSKLDAAMQDHCIKLDNSFGPSAGDCHGSIDFTLLFEQSILTILPASLFLIIGPIRVYLLHQTNVKVKHSAFAHFKSIIITIFSALNLVLLVLWARKDSRCRTKVTIGAAAVTLVSNFSLGALSYYEHRYSVKPSDILAIFLFPTLLFDAAQCRSLWLIGCDRAISSVFSAAVALKTIIFVTECWAKTRWLAGYFQETTPEHTSGLFSHASSYWLNPLLWTGRSHQLIMGDLFDIEDENTSERRRVEFRRNWNACPDTSSKNRLLLVLLKTIRSYVLAPVLPRLAWIAVMFAQPFVLQRILSFISHPAQDISIGYGLIAAIGLIYLLIGLTKAQYNHALNTCMVEIRNVVVTAIYETALEVDSTALGTGTTSTLINNDVDIIMTGLRSLHEIWASVVTLAVAMWLIYNTISWAFAAPLVTILVLTMLVGLMSPALMRSRRRWLSATERRIEATVRNITYMKGLKLMGMGEEAFEEIQQLRVSEIEIGKTYRIFDSLATSISNTMVSCCTLASFAIYAVLIKVQGRDFDVGILFTSLTLIIIAIDPIFTLIQDVPNLASALVCIRRVQLFLVSEKKPLRTRSYSSSRTAFDDHSLPNSETELKQLKTTLTSPILLSAADATFGWLEQKPILHNVTFDILRRSINVVIGPVGSGKSTLLKSLLGETKLLSGSISTIPGCVAFCEQKAWLQNHTLRDNILGISVYDDIWYKTVMDACALTDDISILPMGDATQIGSQGFALSGGQKQRLSLARAIYSKAKIVILDDVFSGLDSTTEKHIFTKLLGPDGLLRKLEATVILVTHSVRWIPSADHIIVLDGGRIIQQGSLEELNASEDFVHRFALEGKDESLVPTTQGENAAPQAVFNNRSEDEVALAKSSREWSVYAYYSRSVGIGSAIIYFSFTCASAASNTYQTVWLQNWASSTYGTSLLMYMLVYAGLVLTLIIIFFMMCYQLMCVLVPKSGLELHKRQLRSLVNAPLSFFTSTDTGEIANRFSHDILYVDTGLPTALLNTLGNATGTVGNIVVIVIGAPWVGLSLPVLFIILWQIQNFYLNTSRQLRYMELEAKAPLYTHFFETLEGLHSIRAFGWSAPFRKQNVDFLRNSQKPLFLLAAIQIWLQFVLDCVVVALVLTVSCLSVTLRGNSNVGLVGLALFNLISLSQGLTNIIASWTQLETSIAAVSRIRDFCKSTPIEENSTSLSTPAPDWPSSGIIAFENVSAAYELGKDLVLKDISFSAQSGQKIGICGKTGSGKSSLVQTIFRLLEISQGRILIDGIDITSMPRDLLRSRLTILPQDSFFVPGTIEQNLLLGTALKQDGEKEARNTKIQEILHALNLWDKTHELGGMDAALDPEKMLSQGERQLFCLARALLNPSPILILDEATSSMDAQTDALAQKALREFCAHRTILCVAHRLDTILDSDRVLVLDKGRIVEEGAPNDLVNVTGSVFGGLLGDR